jgi:hypothetical protein
MLNDKIVTYGMPHNNIVHVEKAINRRGAEVKR